MTPEELRDLLPDFALGLLDDELAVEVVRYLRGSAAARAEGRLYVQAAEALALSAPTIAPLPVETLDRIRAYVHARDGHGAEAAGSHAPAEQAREAPPAIGSDEEEGEDEEEEEVEQERPRRGLFGRFRRAPREEEDEDDDEQDDGEGAHVAATARAGERAEAAAASEAPAPPKRGFFRRRYEPEDDEEEYALPARRPAPPADREPRVEAIYAPHERGIGSLRVFPELGVEETVGPVIDADADARANARDDARTDAPLMPPPPVEETEEEEADEALPTAGESPSVAGDSPPPQALESATGSSALDVPPGTPGEIDESPVIPEAAPGANDAPAWAHAAIEARDEPSAPLPEAPEEQAPPTERWEEEAPADQPEPPAAAEPQFDGWAPEPSNAAELSPSAETWAPELSFASAPDSADRAATAPAAGLAEAAARQPAAAGHRTQAPPEVRQPAAAPLEVRTPAFPPVTDLPARGKRGLFGRGSRSPAPVEEELDEEGFEYEDEDEEEGEERGRRFLGLFGRAKPRGGTGTDDEEDEEEDDDEEWEDEDEPAGAGGWKPAALLLGFAAAALFGTAAFLFVAYHNASQASDQAKSQRDARPIEYSLMPKDPPTGDDAQKPYVSAELFVPAPPRPSVMTLNGWPANKKGETYQLWAEKAGGKVSFVVAFFGNAGVVSFNGVPQDAVRVFVTAGPVRQAGDPLPTAPVGPRWAESDLVDIRK